MGGGDLRHAHPVHMAGGCLLALLLRTIWLCARGTVIGCAPGQHPPARGAVWLWSCSLLIPLLIAGVRATASLCRQGLDQYWTGSGSWWLSTVDFSRPVAWLFRRVIEGVR